MFCLAGDSVTYRIGTFINATRVGAIEAPSNQSSNGMRARRTETNAPPAWTWPLIAIPVGFAGMVIAGGGSSARTRNCWERRWVA
jgi:hypothetical protein